MPMCVCVTKSRRHGQSFCRICHNHTNIQRTNVFLGVPRQNFEMNPNNPTYHTKLVVYPMISPLSPHKPASDASSLVPFLGQPQRAERFLRSCEQRTRKLLVMFGLTCMYVYVFVKIIYIYIYMCVCVYVYIYIYINMCV
jgi:hypothetical protein